MNTSSIFDKKFNTSHQLLFDLFDDYLMIIWWLFDDYLMIICIIVIICYIEILHFYVHVAKMWTQTTHPSSHSPGYAASQYRRTGLHVQWRWSQICLFHRCKAPPMHDRGEHITPSSAHEGERVILEGRKRDRIRNQVLARFLTRARLYARERDCKLARAPIMRWYTCAEVARASVYVCVSAARVRGAQRA